MKEYKVDIGGVEHTLQLSDEDAKARGLKASDVKAVSDEGTASKQAPAPANKARSASDKS